MRARASIAALTFLAACATAPEAVPGAESDPAAEAAALAAVEAHLEVLRTGDGSVWERTTLSGSGATVLIEEDAGWRIAELDRDRLVSAPPADAGLAEPIYAPTVLVRGPMAVVWAPYDLLREGERVHCGVDAFFLARDGEVWKVAEIMWTQEKSGCDALLDGLAD